MAESKRSYRSALRDAQARTSRRLIVNTAARLFVERGYAPTTIDSIALAAGVNRKTVFTSVGGKAMLLKLAWDWAVVGDDEPLSMAERSAVANILSAGDPREAVRLWVDMVLEVAARATPLARIVEVAADTDPDVARLRDNIQHERYQGTLAFIIHLASADWLRSDLSQHHAADLCWVHTDPVVYRRLVIDRGWTVDELGDWMTASVATALLANPHESDKEP
jgi:AcrR family transcriptional regulator